MVNFDPDWDDQCILDYDPTANALASRQSQSSQADTNAQDSGLPSLKSFYMTQGLFALANMVVTNMILAVVYEEKEMQTCTLDYNEFEAEHVPAEDTTDSNTDSQDAQASESEEEEPAAVVVDDEDADEDDGCWWDWECGVYCYDDGYCRECNEWWYDPTYDKGDDCVPEWYFGYELKPNGQWKIVVHYTECPKPEFHKKPKKPKRKVTSQDTTTNTGLQGTSNTNANQEVKNQLYNYYDEETNTFCYECQYTSVRDVTYWFILIFHNVVYFPLFVYSMANVFVPETPTILRSLTKFWSFLGATGPYGMYWIFVTLLIVNVFQESQSTDEAFVGAIIWLAAYWLNASFFTTQYLKQTKVRKILERENPNWDCTGNDCEQLEDNDDSKETKKVQPKASDILDGKERGYHQPPDVDEQDQYGKDDGKLPPSQPLPSGDNSNHQMPYRETDADKKENEIKDTHEQLDDEYTEEPEFTIEEDRL